MSPLVCNIMHRWLLSINWYWKVSISPFAVLRSSSISPTENESWMNRTVIDFQFYFSIPTDKFPNQNVSNFHFAGTESLKTSRVEIRVKNQSIWTGDTILNKLSCVRWYFSKLIEVQDWHHVNNDLPWDPKIVAVIDRWSLFWGSFVLKMGTMGRQNSGRCWKVVVRSDLTVYYNCINVIRKENEKN